jgi:hypothetical protein
MANRGKQTLVPRGPLPRPAPPLLPPAQAAMAAAPAPKRGELLGFGANSKKIIPYEILNRLDLSI